MYYIWRVQHEGREIMKIIHHLKNFDPQVMLQYLKLKRTIFWLTEKWLSSYYLSSPTQIFGIILLDLIKNHYIALIGVNDYVWKHCYGIMHRPDTNRQKNEHIEIYRI